MAQMIMERTQITFGQQQKRHDWRPVGPSYGGADGSIATTSKCVNCGARKDSLYGDRTDDRAVVRDGEGLHYYRQNGKRGIERVDEETYYWGWYR